MIRKLFITARDHFKQEQLIEALQQQLKLQIAIDGYKDTLADTLKSLLAYKEEAIDHLKGKIEELKNE